MRLEGKEFSKRAAVRVWRRFRMMNDLISCFVLLFEHFNSVSIYVTLKNKLQNNNVRKNRTFLLILCDLLYGI